MKELKKRNNKKVICLTKLCSKFEVDITTIVVPVRFCLVTIPKISTPKLYRFFMQFLSQINHLPNARSTHDLVATSVTLASFIKPRAVVCVSCAHSEFLRQDSVCIHRAMRRFASPTHRIRREVVLLFIYRLCLFFLHDLTCGS